MDYTGDNAYADGFVILVDGRDMFRLKAIAVWLENYPISQFVRCKKDLGWTNVWELNPNEVESLRLKASVSWRGGGSFWLRSSMIEGGGPCPFFSHTLAFTLQLKKSR
jgi:hypothetical protein